MKRYIAGFAFPLLVACSSNSLDLDTTSCEQVDFAINDIKTARGLGSPLVFSIPETIDEYLSTVEKEFKKEGMKIQLPKRNESIKMIADYCAQNKHENLRNALKSYTLYVGLKANMN